MPLQPPILPRLPFSSPMGEEVLSPTTPTPNKTPPQDHKQQSGKRRIQEDGMSRGEMDMVSNGSTYQRDRRKREDSPSTKPTGLNLVTNFSKPSGLTQPAPFIPQPRKDSLNARLHQPANLGHSRSGKSTKGSSSSSKGRIEDLRRANSKVSTLSPSDRAVVIGISVPQEKAAQHAISPDNERARTLGLDLTAQNRHSVTPSILITPAKETAPWSAEDDDDKASHRTSPGRRRATSSVYSQAPGIRPGFLNSPVPPVPPLPKGSKRKDLKIETQRDLPPRITSIGTDFDGIDSPVSGIPSRPSSMHEQLKVLRRNSADTLATRPRSQGWWNHIVSPFWPRSPMTLKSPSMEQLSSTPYPTDSPPLTRATPRSQSPQSARTSWTDSPIEEEPVKPALTFDQIPSARRSITALRGGDTPLGKPPVQPALEGFGLAAEYFDACFHDTYSETPYFECQNHVCLPSSRHFEPNGLHPEDKDLVGDRGLSSDQKAKGLTTGGHAKAGDNLQVPGNRFSAAFHEALGSNTKHRRISSATEIEDLDTTPYVREAEVAPVVKAPEPIPAAQPPYPLPKHESSLPAEVELPKRYRTPPPPPVAEISPGAVKMPGPSPSRTHRSSPAITINPGPARTIDPVTPPRRQASPLPPPEAAEIVKMPEPQPPKRYRTPPPPPVLPPSDPPSDDRSVISKTPTKRYVAIMPPEPPPHDYDTPVTRSPGPLTPKPQKGSPKPQKQTPKPVTSTAKSIDDEKPPRPWQATYVTHNHYYHGSPAQSEKTSMGELFPPPPKREDRRPSGKSVRERERQVQRESEKRTVKTTSSAGWGNKVKSWLGEFRRTGEKNQKKQDGKMSRKKKRLLFLIGLALLSIIIIALILAMTLTRKGDSTPVQSQWLNLTGYPPIPTGMTTIAQPDNAVEVSGCVSPQTMWSCALPKEEQNHIAPNAPNQPNFRLEIRFQNGTNGTTAVNATSDKSKRWTDDSSHASAKAFIRDKVLQIKRSFTDALFDPSPDPPSREEQIFLGNTTDHNQQPFDGESTPFFMSFHPSDPLPSKTRTMKRDDNNKTTNASNPFPSLASLIPSPSTDSDGTASPATLYPFPTAQPLRLYDRGRPTEHYGFYTYFDRSIFLKSTKPLNVSLSSSSSDDDSTPVPDDTNGGSPSSSAKVRCTWRDTRFLVQIWTRKSGSDAQLLQGNSTTNGTSSSKSHDDKHHIKTLANSSANDFSRPGSFPYPITITLDRHGGNIREKEIYCYPLDDRERPLGREHAVIQLEDRAFGANKKNKGEGLVNPAQGPWGKVKVTGDEGGPGGIDGGEGGCGCVWRNFGAGRS